MSGPARAPRGPAQATRRSSHGSERAASANGRAGKERPAAQGSGPAPAAADNLSLQALYASGAIRAQLRVGAPDDPLEAEADRMADAALAGKPAGCTCAAGHPPCPRCQAAAHGALRRKPRSRDLLAHASNLELGHARGLGDDERRFFEAHYQADLSEVRIHDNPQAAASAAQLNARAFTLGTRIAFAAGEYRPHTGEGRRLLGHELAHVAQDDGTRDSAPVIRRDPPASSSSSSSAAPATDDAPQVCTAQGAATSSPSSPLHSPLQSLLQGSAGPQMCMAPQDPAHPTVLNLTGTLSERVASFKELVKTTAIHRLMANKRNLGMWADLVGDTIPAEDIAALGMTQSGAARPYFELQQMRDPLMRELRARQAFGQFRACTGCHLETQISASRGEREAVALEPWATPTEMRAGIRPHSVLDLHFARLGDAQFAALTGGGTVAGTAPDSGLAAASRYQPPAGSAEADLHRLFPDPAATREALRRAEPIMQALGPEGYKVLPQSILDGVRAGAVQDVRAQILSAIATRQGNYEELIGKIRANEVGYEHFGPVIRSVLPLADEEVRRAIQQEMDRNDFWSKVEQVVVAAMSALALLLAIFPPTSAAGIAFFAALEISLGYYGVQHGQEAQRLGSAYSLATGAHDVFTIEQQRAGDAMVLGGFLSQATGYLGMFSGAFRMGAAMPRTTPLAAGSSTALARTGTSAAARTFQQGEFVVTVTEDGAMFVTVASRPDLVIMVRGETATLYQLLEGGGMRVAATATVPARATGATSAAGTAGGTGSAPLLLGAGSEAGASTALVPVGPTALTVPGVPGVPAAPSVPAAPGAAAAPGRVLITPPPRTPLQLGPGNPTALSWDDISRMRQPMLWQERETYMQQLYGAPGQQHFPVPNTGGRYVDVPAPQGGGMLAGEVKSYTRWIGVPGQHGGVSNSVELTERIQEQINRDVWLRNNVPGYDPRWMFTDAPPSPPLRQALRDAGITFIEYR